MDNFKVIDKVFKTRQHQTIDWLGSLATTKNQKYGLLAENREVVARAVTEAT